MSRPCMTPANGRRPSSSTTFDEFYETGVVGTNLYNQVLTDDDGGPVYQRTYYTHVGAPRSIGVRFKYTFE